jgi:hypothetical protein
MSALSITSTGSFSNTERFLALLHGMSMKDVLSKYGQQGVDALAAATPVDSGETAASWAYEVTGGSGNYEIAWTNSHIDGGVNIAVILQYGHGTGTGGYVTGRDYINPAIRPIFDRIADEVWKEVTSQ